MAVVATGADWIVAGLVLAPILVSVALVVALYALDRHLASRTTAREAVQLEAEYLTARFRVE